MKSSNNKAQGKGNAAAGHPGKMQGGVVGKTIEISVVVIAEAIAHEQ
jgi:hypothetical protein